jgi:penicillin-binding protein 1A
MTRSFKIASSVKIILVIIALLIGLVVIALVSAYFYINSTLPRVETLADYRPPIVTRIFADDGTQVAEFSKERRILVPVSRLPKQLVQAFVAAEDANFYQHSGVDFTSILRASIKNIMAGGIVQGGSTITQQVTKSLLLTPEKKFSRKFKEAILAWRIENALAKEDILYLYLNQIFLGHGSYGVQAAAENYFDKNVEPLTLAECALLAGLPQAPSRYSPYQNLPKARERQKYVLGRMVEEMYITRAEADKAMAEKLTIHPRVNTHASGASYFAEQIRRYLEENYGAETLYAEGLQVYTTMNLEMQQAAQNAVRENLLAHDRRRGYRGPLQVLSLAEEPAFLAEQEKLLAATPVKVGDQLQAVVSEVTARGIQARIGKRDVGIALKDANWAAPILGVRRSAKAAGNANGRATLLPPGAVILVRVLEVEKERWQLALDQEPLAEGALVAIDPGRGWVKALVGGYDFKRSQFNRAVQARRLPGSAIKPVIYAAAIDKGYTPASIFLDAPLVFNSHNPAGELVAWKPQNYSHKYEGATSMRRALTDSNNVVTIRILEAIGIDYAIAYARNLGIESPIARDLTFALGSSAITPMELTTAYSVFASGGIRQQPVFITRILDRDGRILESIDPADALISTAIIHPQTAERVMTPESAYLITNMMESVVREGTGGRAQELARPVAGKTGTTNDLKDAWFGGFIPQLVAVSWIGYDQEKTLGHGETGAQAALPGWISFMKQATRSMEPLPFPIPDTIEFYNIDPATGLLAADNADDLNIEAFAPGTAPTESASDARSPKARDFNRIDLAE